MKQLQKKKKTQIKLMTWLVKPNAVLLSQHRTGRQVTPCPCWWALGRNLSRAQHVLGRWMKGQHGSAEPGLLLSALTSPWSPFCWRDGQTWITYYVIRPGSFRTTEAFRTLANWILRIHLNSKSKICNNEKADTVAQHGFGLTAA